MGHYAGIDVSLKDSSVCVVDATGRIVREAKVASEPEALVAWFRGLRFEVARIGLEAGPLSRWLHAGLNAAGFEGFCCGLAKPSRAGTNHGMAKRRRAAQVRPDQSFKGRQFTAEVILWAVRWYLMFPISYRDLSRQKGDY